MIWLVISLDAYEQEKAKADKLVREERDKAFEELREMEELVDMAIAHSTREYLRLKDDPDMVVYAHEAQRAAGDLIFARMSQLDERTVG